MTDKLPSADERLQDREDSPTPLDNVGRAEAARASAGTIAGPAPASASTTDMELAYESGVELKARSQWAYARMRFFRHRLAVVSLFVLILIGLIAIFAKHVAPYGFNDQDYLNIAKGPTRDHPFGTDLLGRDYLSRVIYGLQTSLWVAFFVAILSTLIGTAIGAVAGYYGGTVDNLLMRFTDLILTQTALHQFSPEASAVH